MVRPALDEQRMKAVSALLSVALCLAQTQTQTQAYVNNAASYYP